LKIVAFILFLLGLGTSSFGLQLLDGVMEDAFVSNASSPCLAGFIETGRCEAGSSFTYNNTINSSNLEINNYGMNVYAVLPLDVNKSALVVSADKSYSRFNLNQDLAALNMSGSSNLVRLLYAARLNDYLDVGVGVNQASGASTYGQNLGFSYGVRLSPLPSLAIEYNTEKNRLVNTVMAGYSQDMLASPAGGTRDRSGINAIFAPGGRLKFLGSLGSSDNEEDVRLDASDQRYSYARMGRGAIYGSVGVVVDYDKFNLELTLLGSETNLSSSGGFFGESSPSLVLGEESLEKTADLAASIRAKGFRIGLEGLVSDRLKLKTDVSYFKAFLGGDARIWNNWFFGMVKKLDTQSVLPIESVDLLTVGLGAKYTISDDVTINYSFKQIIPLAVSNRETVGDDFTSSQLISGGVASGGNTQTFALSCEF
jgi:hypothetical protein